MVAWLPLKGAALSFLLAFWAEATSLSHTAQCVLKLIFPFVFVWDCFNSKSF